MIFTFLRYKKYQYNEKMSIKNTGYSNLNRIQESESRIQKGAFGLLFNLSIFLIIFYLSGIELEHCTPHMGLIYL